MHLLRFFRKRVRHPFFPHLAADDAATAPPRSQALAGTFADLAHAAERGTQVRRAVFVLTTADRPLTDGQRDQLWRWYQAPVYALLEREGRLVAWECEAQDGMHVAGATHGTDCGCGRPGVVRMSARAMAHAADSRSLG